MTDPSSSRARVARAYLAAFDDRDPAAIAAHVTPDFVNEQTAALGSGCVGRDVYQERLSGFLESMVALHYQVDALIAAGDEVAVFYTMTGRWQSRHPFTMYGAQRLVIPDRLIARRVDYWDSAAFLLQVDDAAAQTLQDLGIG